jgi:protein SCO1/2
VWIANFIFTSCTMVCPRLTADMAKVQTHLRNRGVAARIVSFSVDPETDTPQKLKAYGEKFGARFDTWSFLTGPEKAIERTVVDGFKTAMSRGDVGDFDVVHGSKFVLVDKQSRIRGYYDSTDPAETAKLLTDAEELQ